MGSIYKRADSPFYHCRIKIGDRSFRRSTKQLTAASAKAAAIRLQIETTGTIVNLNSEDGMKHFDFCQSLREAAEAGTPLGPMIKGAASKSLMWTCEAYMLSRIHARKHGIGTFDADDGKLLQQMRSELRTRNIVFWRRRPGSAVHHDWLWKRTKH